MLRAAIAALAMLVTSSMMTSNASAGIIPCTGESLVKVLDVYYPRGLDGRQVIQLRDQKVHLGYLFKGCFKGEWVGYIAPHKPHVALNDQQLRALLYVTGLNELPPVPSYWSSPQNYGTGMVWMIVGLFLLIAAVLQQMGFSAPKKNEAETEIEFDPPAGSALAARVDGVPTAYRPAFFAMERASSEYTRIAMVGPVQAPREAVQHAHNVARFGKR